MDIEVKSPSMSSYFCLRYTISHGHGQGEFPVAKCFSRDLWVKNNRSITLDYICRVEDFVEVQLCKLCAILPSGVFTANITHRQSYLRKNTESTSATVYYVKPRKIYYLSEYRCM